MGTIGGNSTYGVIIADALSGTSPSGNIIYLCAINAQGQEKFMQKIKELAGGSSYANRDGKYSADITITNCYIVKNVAGSNTAEFNAIVEQFRKWHDAGDAPIYLWLYNFVDSDYVHVGQSGATAYDYQMGYITDFQWELSHGNIYYFRTLKFKRCLI